MKKFYITPSSTLCRLQTEGMLAGSNIPTSSDNEVMKGDVTDADYGDYGQQFGNKKEGSLGGNTPVW